MKIIKWINSFIADTAKKLNEKGNRPSAFFIGRSPIKPLPKNFKLFPTRENKKATNQ